MNLNIIGYAHSGLKDKFGTPRQSGLVKELTGYIEFVQPYGQKEAFNGLEDYEYIWILFLFHKSINNNFSATVKPPKLGGNIKKGVFATRSPFRPNNIGLSSVRLDKIEFTRNNTILWVSGLDLIDGTPILDIKPYLPYADSHTNAKAGFSDTIKDYRLNVNDPDNICNILAEDRRKALFRLLEEDPRPGFHQDSDREYGMFFDNYNIRFTIKNKDLLIKSINES